MTTTAYARLEIVPAWIRRISLQLVFFLYALFGAPILARALKEALQRSDPSPFPALILAALLILEPIGLRWKSLFLRRRAAEAGHSPEGGLAAVFAAAGIGHVIVGVFLGMMVLDAMGPAGVGGGDPAPAWLAATVLLLLVRECWAFGATAGQRQSIEPPGHFKEWLADLILLLFSGVAYTAWWESLLDLEEVGAASLPWLGWAVLIPVLGGLYLVVYLPLRLSFLLEEHYLAPRRGRRLRLFIELAMGLALGMYPMLF